MDVDSDGLFAVNMLAGGYGGAQVVDVKEGRRGDLDQVNVGRGGELLESVGAVGEELPVDGRAAERSIELIEAGAAGGEVVGEEIGDGDYLCRSVFREGFGDGTAA